MEVIAFAALAGVFLLLLGAGWFLDWLQKLLSHLRQSLEGIEKRVAELETLNKAHNEWLRRELEAAKRVQTRCGRDNRWTS